MGSALLECDRRHDMSDAFAYMLGVDLGNNTFEELCILPSYRRCWRDFFTPQFKKSIDVFVKKHVEEVRKVEKAPLMWMWFNELDKFERK